MKMKKNILQSPLLRQYVVVAAVNLSVFTTGMSYSWPSPMLIKLKNATESPIGRAITNEEASWIVSIGFLCSIFSNVILGTLIDKLGRKKSIILSFIPKLAVGFLFVFATEVWMIILGRAIIIMFDHFTFTVSPTYSSEIASKEYRGALGTMLQLFSASGELVTYSVGPFVSYKTYNIVFVSVILISMIPSFFLPESPAFLYSKGQNEEALQLLKYFRGNAELAQKEIEEFNLNSSNHQKLNKLSLFKDVLFRKTLGVGLILFTGFQCVGFNAVTFYLQTILQSTNTNVSPEIASVIIGVLQVLTSLTSHSLLSSNLGRKTILLSTLCGVFLGMVGLATFFTITTTEGYIIVGFMNYLPLISLVLVICCFIAGMGSLIWVVAGEIFTDSSRAFGVSLCLSSSICLNFLITKLLPTVTTAVGPSVTYWFFSAMIILFISLIAIFLPETKGKTFSEIQMILRGKTHDKDLFKS